MLWVVTVKAVNRGTGMRIQGRYAVCSNNREEAVSWVTHIFEQTNVEFEVEAKHHSEDVLVLEMKQLGRAPA